MRISSLACCCLFFVLACDCSHSAVQFPPAPQADERLKLSTPRASYLLGEPVPLELVIRNNSKETIKLVQTFAEEVSMWISRAGEDFRPFQRNTMPKYRDRQVLHLAPGGRFALSFRVLRESGRDFKLAMPEPGEYRIYAEFPLWLFGGKQVATVSNVVPVSIKQPEGEDAQVWEQLKDPSFLRVLPNGGVLDQQKDLPMKMAKLMRSYPASAYAPAMRHALAKTYFRRRLGLPEKDQEQLAQSLDIARVEALADERLEARRHEVLEQDIPLDKVLASLNKVGVPLDAAPELKAKKVNLIDAYFTLRGSMRSLSDDLEASWERRGNGYYLVPFDANSPKRFKDKRD